MPSRAVFAYPGLPYPGQVYPAQKFDTVTPSTGRSDPNFRVGYRFDLLDRDERLIGVIESVAPGGDITWHSTKSIKSGGKMKVTDVGQNIDWPNARVRPTRVHTYGDGYVEEYPLGVFLMSAPKEKWDALGRVWDVELLDKCSILDEDIVTDDEGNPRTFSAREGEYVVDIVAALIQSTGEDTPAIGLDISDSTLGRDMTWEVGTTVLRIINDLLNASNHFSIWCDGLGQYRVERYRPPSDRPVEYVDGTAFGWKTPFSYGESSLMSPDWTRDLDIYAIPNRWVCIGQGDEETEGPVAYATNEDPDSPFSYQARGRWITQVETGVEAVDQESLQAQADRSLETATATTVGIVAEHLFLPKVAINTVAHFLNDPADLDMNASVLNTTVPLDPTKLCKTEFREFSGSNPTWDKAVDEEGAA